MTSSQIASLCAGLGFILFLLLLFGSMVRFSILHPRRIRGWQSRLRLPNSKEVETRWKVRLPDSLELLYRSAFILNEDFYLAPPGARSSHWFWIEQFIPLTVRDVSAWLALTGVPGIPIAIDGKDRAYYLPFADLRRSGPVPVLLHSYGRKYTEVASNIDQFMSFEPKTMSDRNAAKVPLSS